MTRVLAGFPGQVRQKDDGGVDLEFAHSTASVDEYAGNDGAPADEREFRPWGRPTMRFMVLIKATRDSEAGKMPDEQLLAAMGRFNEELERRR